LIAEAFGGHKMRSSNMPRGFTLIELMIVLVVAAIIMGFAVPMFTEQMRATKRSEAFQTLSDLQLRQEQFRSNNATYATTTELTGAATHPSPSGYYNVVVDTPGGNCSTGVGASNANSFRLTATAAGAQASDSKCATILLTSLCGSISKTSTPAGNACWK
jgi:type IV pilus assembly protein PilE